MEEVRYHMLRPEQVLERRKKYPVAYIPLGNLEWHGPHNPLGADTLQAEGLAIKCAQKGGGLAFPPLYYGENRLEALKEANSADKKKIAREMELPPENFESEAFIFTVSEQTLNYNKLLLHVLCEVETLGFEVGVLIAGHYPLIDHARAAVALFNQRRFQSKKETYMLAWATVDYLLLKNLYPQAGDHGGGWETSHLMALHPETVDLEKLPASSSEFIGHSDNNVHASSALFGNEVFDKATEIITEEVDNRLKNKHIYHNHGMAFIEDLEKHSL
ncbi:MAG: creatininase family protein [Victivallaceae bacterium]|nr:creatininase family protein [Victivallaceae bacterium]